VAEPARVNPRSRREGVSKECVSWIQVNSRARGPRTSAMLVTPPWREICKKNQKKPPSAATASTNLSHDIGLARRR